jgi:flagellar operon protein
VNPALHSPAVTGPVGPVGAPAPGLRPAAAPAPQGPSFAEHLRRADTIRFSGHALERLDRRGIAIGEATMARLDDGLQRAAGKGSRESVIFVDGTAFVVSVPNRTVITAVSPEHMRQHVFTNIDSAVIA